MKLLYPKTIILSASLLALTATSNAATKNTAARDTVGITADTKETKAATPKADVDTSWKPIRRVWGYAFGDLYFAAHADKGGRGGETNYGGVPSYRNAFQFRRIYLGYDYDITKKFTATLLLAAEPNASTSPSGTTSISNSDNLVDNKMSFYIKNANLRVKDLWKGTDFIIGEQTTPTTFFSEQLWAYRFDERTVADIHKFANTYDLGAGLQGTFDPSTKNFGYSILVGNNTQATLLSAANANTGFYKEVYGDLWAKFFDKHLQFEIYGDYVRTAPATAAVGGQSHNMWKGIAAYTTPLFTFGVEAFTNKITNGLTATEGTTKTAVDAVAQGISIYARGAIVKDKLGYFARFDSYNPDNDFNTADTYTVNTNISSYSPYQKEQFYNAGLDFTPTPNVHFAPNIWLYEFKDQRTPTATGYLPNDHTLVYRLTFFFTFGK
jgi:hypothetical protein